MFTVHTWGVVSILSSNSKWESIRAHFPKCWTFASSFVGILHKMQWEINKSRTPKTRFLAIVSKLIKLSMLLYCSRVPFGSRPVNHILLSEQQTVYWFSLQKKRENPIVFRLPPPLPLWLSAGLWRSAGFRKRDGEMFPVAGLSAAD